MLGVTFAGRPGQGERLPRNTGDPGVTVGLDDVMTLQPGLVGNMRSIRDRPPPAREVTLPSVRGRLPEWPCPAEIDLARVLKSDGVLTAAIICVNELDAVGQFARNNGRVMSALRNKKLKGDHVFDDARSRIEISRDTLGGKSSNSDQRCD